MNRLTAGSQAIGPSQRAEQWSPPTFAISPGRLRQAAIGIAVLVGPLLLLTAIVDVGLGKAIQGTVILFLVNLIAVIGFGIYSGNTGILSFGHVAFMNVGAHFSALLTMPVEQKAGQLPDLPGLLAASQMGLLPAILLTILVVALFAALIGWPIARLAGASAIIATLALLGAVYSLSIGAVEFTKGSQALFGVPRLTTIWIAFACAGLAILVARLYRDSRAGLEAQATREDELAAASIGIAIVPRRLLAWVISAAVAGVAGVLMGHYLTVFSPKEFYFAQTFALLAMLIVGGMTTVSGAVLGTLLVTILIEVLRRIEEGPQIGPVDLPQVFGLTTLGLGICIIVVMIKRRDGLVGYREIDEQLRQRGASRIASDGRSLPVSPSTAYDAVGGQQLTIRAENVTRRFGGLIANQNVSLQLHEGEILGLIGPNGSGKTTLLNVLSRLLPPSSGKVFVSDIDVGDKPPYWMARNRIARTFQNIRLFQHLTVFENVYIAALASGRSRNARMAEERAADLLREFDLASQADAPAASLPYGAQRRLEIARALATGPRLLLLDEPAAGMNEVESDALFHLLSGLRNKEGIGFLIVEHDLSLILRLCDRIVVLNKGEVIAEGPPEAIQQDPAVIEAYIGTKRAHQPTGSMNPKREDLRNET